MKGKIENKIGATTQTYVIGLVILITSAAVIFYFLYRSPYQEQFTKETCRDSVILRGSWLLKNLPEETKPPLKCQTTYKVIKTTDQAAIKRDIANEMFDCWWMLGNGKIDFIGDEFLELGGWVPKESACVLCSVISFNEKVQKRVPTVGKFNEYLEKNKPPLHKVTYIQYFTDQKDSELELLEKTTPTLFTKEQYAVLYMTIKGTTPGDIAQRAVIGAPIEGLVSGKALSKLLPKVALSKLFIGGAIALGTSEVVSGILTYQAAGEKCDGRNEGCTILMLIPYEPNGLGQVCDELKSIP